MRNESTDATSTKWSMSCSQGNRHNLKPSNCRGPGVGSPNALKTLWVISDVMLRTEESDYPIVVHDGFTDLRYDAVPVMQPEPRSARGQDVDGV
jgi:hypothetical protein